MKRFALIVLASLLAASGPAAQDLERLFKAAVNTETVDRNCKAAIEQYKKVVAGANRSLAAQALLRMAGCHQSLGDDEARRLYEQIVRDYRDQPDVVAQAQARLTPGAAERPRGDRIVRAGADTTWGDGRVSPDGRYISYVSYGGPDGLNLMLHDLAAKTERAITHVDWNGGAAGESAFSPDGKQLAFGWNTYAPPSARQLRVATLDRTGAPQIRTLYASDENGLDPTDWSPDGKTLAVLVSRPDRTKRIGLLGMDGSLRVLKTIENWRAVNKMFFSPDGKYLAYDMPTSDTEKSGRDLFIIAVDGSDETPVHDPADDVVMGWTPDGRHLLFASDRSGSIDLWALPVADGKPTSTAPLLVKSNVGTMLSLGLTSSGTLHTVKTVNTMNLQVLPVDLVRGKVTDRPIVQIYRAQTPQKPAWSPDGGLLAYSARSATDRVYVAIREIESNRVRELHPAFAYIPLLQWLPDGKSLLVNGRDTKGRWGSLRIDVESGRETPIDGGPLSPAGTKIYNLIPDSNPASRGGIVVERDLGTGAERKVFTKPDATGSLHLSPDGKWIVYIRTPPIDSSNPGAKTSTVFFHPVDGTPPREIHVPAMLGAYHDVEWMPDGKAVLVPGESSGSTPPTLWLVPLESAAPRKLDIDISTWAIGNGMRIHPSGKLIAHFSGQETREVWALESVVPPAK